MSMREVQHPHSSLSAFCWISTVRSRLNTTVGLQKKVLCDRNGQTVATLTSKLLTMHDTVEIHSADGRRVLAEVKKQLVSLTHGAKVKVTGMQFPLEVKGDFRGKNFQVGHPAPTLPSQRCRQG